MFWTIGLIVAALVAAGFYFKKDETKSFLTSFYTWAAAVAAALYAYLQGFDFTSLLDIFK